MKVKIVLIFVLFSSQTLFAEVDHAKIDSLTKLISTQKGTERIESLIYLSEMYRELSLDKSLETDKEAISYAEKEGVASMKGIIFLNMGKTASMSADFPLALDYYQKAETFLENSKNYEELCKVHIHMGLLYKDMSEYKKALDQMNTAIKIAQEHGLAKQEAGAASSRGSVYLILGDYDKAVEDFQEALKIYTKENDTSKFANTYNNLAIIYWQWNKSELALEMMQKAKDIYEKNNDQANLGRALNNLAKLYYQDFHDTTKALEYYQQSLAIRENMGYQIGIAIVLSNIANVYNDKKQFEEAFNYYDRSLKISKSIGYKAGIALTNYYIGMAYRKNRKWEVSNRYLDSSLVIAKELNLIDYFPLINEAKMTNYVGMRNYDGFMDEFLVFKVGIDSIKRELDSLKFTSSEAISMAEDARAELVIANETIENQRQQFLWIIGILALFSIIAIVWVYLKCYKNPKYASPNNS